jgi:predicted metal-dependent HD superfamily phosphohydrolase
MEDPETYVNFCSQPGDAFRYFDELMSFTQLSSESKIELRDHYMNNRTYHGINHLAFLWHCHVALKDDLLKDPDGSMGWDALHVHKMMANAIACHDVIYDPTQSQLSHGWSEQQSAEWWYLHVERYSGDLQSDLLVHGLNANHIAHVGSFITATADHLGADPRMLLPNEILMHWFLGLDLIPLAAPDYLFDQGGYMLRAEYSHLTHEEWDTGRKAFLAKLDQSPVIYRHPALHRIFEDSARANLKRVAG